MDILIKNGVVLDPETQKEGQRDIALQNGVIVEPDQLDQGSVYTVDAAGCYVFPGLIDFHAHVFQGGSGFGVSPDWLLATGVTTVVDAGSTGCANFEAFYRSVAVQSKSRVLAQINLFPAGQPAYGVVENYADTQKYLEELRQLFEKYPLSLHGLKLRLGEEVVGDRGLEYLETAIHMARQLDLPLIVHASNPPCRSSEIAQRLRPGDVFCHCFHGKGRTILNEDGHVQKEIWEAKERGVIFDACNGISNFCAEVAQKALSEGFLPDIIASDEAPNVFGMNGFAKNLPYLMSKYLELGMSLPDVVRSVTATPAKLLGYEGKLGTLQIGAIADVSLFRLEQRHTVFKDNRGGEVRGTRLLAPQMTICGGQLVYSQVGFPEEDP